MPEATITIQISGAIPLHLTAAPAQPPQPKVLLAVMFDGITVTGDAETMDSNIPEGKRGKFRVTPLDISGNPAVIDGNLSWASADETLLQAVADPASPNQTEAWIQNAVGGSLGSVVINVTGDADQGEGMKMVTVPLSFTAVAGDFAALSVEQVGPLEDIPPGP